jgi:hypothetical protein
VANKVPYANDPWKDRFNRPTIEALRKQLHGEHRKRFDQTRRKLLQLGNLQESPNWQGDSWHWTIAFHVSDEGNPVAILVPAPHDLQLAVSVDPQFVQSLPISRLGRAVREGLDLAAEPFDTRWAIWSIISTPLIDQLVDLVDRKLQYMAKRVG